MPASNTTSTDAVPTMVNNPKPRASKIDGHHGHCDGIPNERMCNDHHRSPLNHYLANALSTSTMQTTTMTQHQKLVQKMVIMALVRKI